jgi:hypothetical protein
MTKGKRRARRSEGHVYKRRQTWWFKWIGTDRRIYYRSSHSADRAVAEGLLRDELQRKARGLAASPDPSRCVVDDLLESLLVRYRTETRRSVGRAELSCRHLLRLFKGVPAIRVTGADVSRYADLRLKDGAAAATVTASSPRSVRRFAWGSGTA